MTSASGGVIMVEVITKTESKNVIRDVESIFFIHVYAYNFTALDEEVLKDVDSAVLLDRNTGTISTPFGVTDIYHLSTGCKIVLFYLYMQSDLASVEIKSKILEITEAGGNALRALFKCVRVLGDQSSIFLLRQSNQIMLLQDVRAKVNGHICESLYRGLRQYGEWV